jgi:hypothetical protein
MHKRKTNLLVIRAGFDSKLHGFVMVLNTLFIFTGCGKKNDARRSKKPNPS